MNDEPRPTNPLRGVLPYAGVAAGGFGVAYLVVLLFVFPLRGQPEEAIVPNVLGLTFDVAATRLNAAGFRAEQGESRYNVGSPRSTVLSETPAPTTSAPKGTRIMLDVSAGQRRAATPNVVGMDREQAALALHRTADQPDTAPRSLPGRSIRSVRSLKAE